MDLNEELKYNKTKIEEAIPILNDIDIINKCISERILALKELYRYKNNLNNNDCKSAISKIYITRIRDSIYTSVNEKFEEYRKWIISELIFYTDIKIHRELMEEEQLEWK